jgi:hypothetical protein
MITALLLFAAWCSVGTGSIVYGWTREVDLSVGDLIACTTAGCVLGPFGIVVGLWMALPSFDKVIIKRRRK